MNYETLNSDEKTQLVMIILDAIEESMEFEDFQETIGMLCEDIPGLECLSDETFSALVKDCWEMYQHSAVATFPE